MAPTDGRLNVGIRVPACRPVTEVATFLGEVEDAGFAFAGLLDSQLVTRDVFATLTAAAGATDHLGLWTSVLNPVTRHVSVLAGASATVAESAPGRTVFVVGSGYSSTATIGLPPATVHTMRTEITRYQALLAGEEVAFEGTRSRLAFAPDRRPPVYVAATGPRMLEVAGEVGDGVLLAPGLHPSMVDRALEHVATGAERAGRDPGSIDVVLYVRTIVDDDRTAAREAARPVCAQWIADDYRAEWLRRAGIDVPARESLPDELFALYPDIVHAEDAEAAARATAFISDDLLAEVCDALGVIGTADDAVDKLTGLTARGIQDVYLMTPDTYTLPTRIVEVFADTVLPALSAAR